MLNGRGAVKQRLSLLSSKIYYKTRLLMTKFMPHRMLVNNIYVYSKFYCNSNTNVSEI